jgi:DNA-binding YbaB/EbfC family protein
LAGSARSAAPAQETPDAKDIAMKDLLGLMGKAKEMQAKFQSMQEEIATLEASGQAGGGMVSVTLTGKFEMKSLKIDPSLLKEDEVEILEDLILAAHNDAKVKVEQIMQEKTKALTAGLPIPPGMKLPFLWKAPDRPVQSCFRRACAV